MAFNDISKSLAGTESREQKIQKLAEQLLRRGLAMTKASARDLAVSMVDTEERMRTPRVEEAPAAREEPGFAGIAAGKTIGQLQEERSLDPEMRVSDAAEPKMDDEAYPVMGEKEPAAPEDELSADENGESDAFTRPEAIVAETSIDDAEDGSLDMADRPEEPVAIPTDEVTDEDDAGEAEPADDVVASDEGDEEQDISDREADDAEEETPAESPEDYEAEHLIEPDGPEEPEKPEDPDASLIAASDDAEDEDRATRELLEAEGGEDEREESAPESAEEPVEEEVADEQESAEEDDSEELASDNRSDDSADEATEDESSSDDSPAAEPTPPKEDLAKKYGVDINNIFNVNK